MINLNKDSSALDFRNSGKKSYVHLGILMIFLFNFSLLHAQLFSFKGGPSYHNNISENANKLLDALPPVITYTALANTCNVGNRTLVANITDVDGVPTSGAGLPVLYWKVNSGPYNAAVAVSLGGGNYQFTFGGTAIAGNIVSYYIVAQDNAGTPNVIAKPAAGAGGYTTSPPAASTAPTSPEFYVIQNTLTAGIYQIGTGQTYLTLTDAINAYNNSCLAGAVTFELIDAAYGPSETFPILISNPQASAVNTLLIKPKAGVNPVISGASSEALIKFNGADYITIDGSNVGGTSRNLTLTNTSAGTSSCVIWMASFNSTNGSTNNVIKNCNITGNTSTTTFAGIASGSGVVINAFAEAANLNNVYQNNNIYQSYHGIYINGLPSGETGTVITNNQIGSSLLARKLGYRGIFITNQTGMTISGNLINGVNSSVFTGSEPDASGGIFVSGTISGGIISANKIYDIRNTVTSGGPSYGISLQSISNASGLRVFNNFIYEVIGYGDNSNELNNGHGIAVLTGGGYGVFHNAINLATNQTTAGISSAMYVGSSVGGTLNVRNNIFSNRQTTGIRYGLYCQLTNAVFSSINYNNYFANGFVGFLGTQRVNIGNWQSATGQDGNSVATNPIFVSATDLHMQLISPMNDQGTPIAGVTSDIDGEIRSLTTPDIGADEFTPPPCASNLGGTASSTLTTICTSGAVILSASGFSFGVGIVYQWEFSTNNITFFPVPGETNPTSANPPVITVTTYYRLRVTCNAGVAGYSNTVTVTVNTPLIVTTTPGARCGAGTVTLGATSSAGTAINWYAAATGGLSLGSGGSYTTPSLASTTTYYAEATFTGTAGSCGPVSPTAQGGSIETQLTSWEVYFDIINATNLVSIDVFPIAAGESSTLQIYNSSNTLLASIPYTTTASGGATAQTIPVNVFLTPGTDYYLYTDLGEVGLPPSGLRRNSSNAVYPYNSADLRITGNNFIQTYFMCYYNWKFDNACSSPRVAVTATINNAAPISATATPASICNGASTSLSATSANTSYVYTWTPGGATGSTITVSPTTTTTYTVSGNDGSCFNSSTVTVTVNTIPSTVTIAPVSVTKCSSSAPQLLTASGGSLADNLINQNFNGPTLPAGWDTSFSGNAASRARVRWTLRPNNYTFAPAGYTFRSNDLSQFYLSNSYDNPSNSITTTILRSPAFSLTGYATASLSFWHFYLPFDGSTGPPLVGPEVIRVQRSADNITWTDVWSHTSNNGQIGTQINFQNRVVDLTAFAGTPVNYIRFSYYSRQDFFWAIDNVLISATSGTTPITWTPTTGLFNDAAGTVPYTGTNTSTVYANPTATQTYTAIGTSVNGCTNQQTINVTIRPVVSGVISGSTTICPSASATLSVALTGTGPWNLTYTDGTTPVTVNNIASSPYTFVVNPATNTTYSITALSDANCSALAADISSTATVSISPTPVSTWVGIDNVWTNPLNWCGGVPTAVKDVVIPFGPSIFPVITTATPVARDISIGTGASITIDAGGTLSISGNITNDGTINNNGTLVLNGSTAQSFPGGTTGTIAAMNILEVNKSAGTLSFDKKFSISGMLKPVSGAIAVNDTITLMSNATGTASLDKVGATASFVYSPTGRFIVERYIPTGVSHGKTWQLLAAATFGQNVNQSWQEGATGPASNPKPGYGTTITSNVPGALAAGFDFATPSGATMKVYNPVTNGYDGIANTNLLPIANDKGYMIFIRGDRSVTAFNQPANTTVLRTTGKVYSPGADAPPSSVVSAGKFQCVGNPYASAIDFVSLLSTSTGLDTRYYVWDPLMPSFNGYGAFQTISSVNGYKPVPGGTANYNALVTYSRIQSGQAFFVFSTPGGTVNFSENNKVSGSQNVFRNGSAAIAGRGFLRLNLYSSDGKLADGNTVAFDNSFDKVFDANDARKLENFGENMGISNGTNLLAIDARTHAIASDTIFYHISNLRTQGYQLRFYPEDISWTNDALEAYLVDSYLNQKWPVHPTDSTIIRFETNTDPSSKVSGRFFLVFKQLVALPVQFLSVNAVKTGESNVNITWKVGQELPNGWHLVEHSTNGQQFTTIGSVNVNLSQSGTYHFIHTKADAGYNYYRITSISSSGEVQKSRVVKVWFDLPVAEVTVYPNPVKEGLANIRMQNLPLGKYIVTIYNTQAQVIFRKNIFHNFNTGIYPISTKGIITSGLYVIEIQDSNGQKWKEKLIIE